MKVLFINPPSSYASYVPPLGVSYISSVLKQRGHKVFGLDGASLHQPLSLSDIVKKVKNISPDVIGVTLNLYFTKGAYALVKELAGFSIPLVAGGPHARVRPFEVIEHGFDIACEGEGEETFLEILDSVNIKKSLRGILGISYRDKKGRIVRNEPRPLIADLNQLPFPDRSLFPLENYFLPNTIKQKKFYFQVFSSRGCPFNCTFCTVSSHKIRVRTPENVCDEVGDLVKTYGINYIQFMDDIFTTNKKWLYRFFDELEKRELRIKWDCESRVDCVDEELLTKMKKAGLNCIFYGVESADPRTLKLIKKRISLEQIRKTLDITSRVKIPAVKLNFMLGFPWEDKSHILNSFKIMKEYHRSLKIRNGIVTPIPYPGTALYNEFHKKYGFSEWWLKDNAFEEPIENKKTIPYYKKNPLMADKFWLDKNFFGYSNSFRNFLFRIILKNERMAYRSYYGVIKSESVFWGSCFSLALSRISLGLENFVFSLLGRIKVFIADSYAKLRNFVVSRFRSLEELKAKYRYDHDKKGNFDWIEKNVYSSLAMPILKILLNTRVSANQISVIMLFTGLLGCSLLIVPGFGWGILGLVFLQLSYILDYVDGALARAKNQASQKGAYIEKVFSLILGTAIFISAGLACFSRYKNIIYIILGSAAALSFFLIRCFYDARIIFKTGEKYNLKEAGSNRRYFKNNHSEALRYKPSLLKTIIRKIDFLWIPIYFIDFLAVAFLTKRLFVFVCFYGIFYPLVTIGTYLTQNRKGKRIRTGV